MEHARPPAELVLEGGPACRADAWKKWLRQFRVFLKASGVSKETSDVQANLLINIIGPDGYDIYSTFKFETEKDRENVDKVISAFNEYFGTKQNLIMARFKFFTRVQENGESIDEYVTALKLLSQRCEFENLEDSLIRDRIVCGVADSTVGDRLLRADDLTLAKAIKICQANEISTDEKRQIEAVKVENATLALDAVWRHQRGPRSLSYNRNAGTSGTHGSSELGARAARAVTGRSGPGAGGRGGAGARGAQAACMMCGSDFCDGDDRCTAKRNKCYMCGNKGHFRVVCPYKNNVYEITRDSASASDDEDLYYIA